MKTKLVVRVALCCCAAMGGHEVTALTISSQESRIYGTWRELGNRDAEGNYPETSGTFAVSMLNGPPLSFSVETQPVGAGWASATVSPMAVSIESYAGASDDHRHRFDSISLVAMSIVRFTTEASFLDLAWSALMKYNYSSREQEFTLSLVDVTTGASLIAGSTQTTFDAPASYSLAVNPDHEYELVLKGWVVSFDAKMADLESSVVLLELAGDPNIGAAGVPDRGITLLMLGCGIAPFLLRPGRRQALQEILSLAG